MKVLLVNECSNVHTLLAKGLKELGHSVTTISGGNGWRNFPRDISVVRRSPSHIDGLRYILQVYSWLPRLRGYDVVQINNPIFFDLRAERLFHIYDRLRRQNGKMVLAAYGTDHFWVKQCMEARPLRYSDHNFGSQVRTDPDALVDQREWLGNAKERLNRYIADNCDAIVPCLYEYWACYHPLFPQKTHFIPLPIETATGESEQPSVTSRHKEQSKVRVFIGIDRDRSTYKGTDIMLRAAEEVMQRYPDRMELRKVVSLPYAEYERAMCECDVVMDQLYSYTPAMNALLAMSKGMVVIGGGEPENYDIIGERELRPIINVEPTYESVRHELEQLVLHPERLPELKRQGIEYVRRHHDYLKVAARYAELYKSL